MADRIGKGHSTQAGRSSLGSGSEADLQERERPWASEEEPEEPGDLGMAVPAWDALEQQRSWGPQEESPRSLAGQSPKAGATEGPEQVSELRDRRSEGL